MGGELHLPVAGASRRGFVAQAGLVAPAGFGQNEGVAGGPVPLVEGGGTVAAGRAGPEGELAAGYGSGGLRQQVPLQAQGGGQGRVLVGHGGLAQVQAEAQGRARVVAQERERGKPVFGNSTVVALHGGGKVLGLGPQAQAGARPKGEGVLGLGLGGAQVRILRLQGIIPVANIVLHVGHAHQALVGTPAVAVLGEQAGAVVLLAAVAVGHAQHGLNLAVGPAEPGSGGELASAAHPQAQVLGKIPLREGRVLLAQAGRAGVALGQLEVVLGRAVEASGAQGQAGRAVAGLGTAGGQPETARISLQAAPQSLTETRLPAQQHGTAHRAGAVEGAAGAGLHRYLGIAAHGQQREIGFAQRRKVDIDPIPKHGRVPRRRAPNADGSQLPRPVVFEVDGRAGGQGLGQRATPKLTERGRIEGVARGAHGVAGGALGHYRHLGQRMGAAGERIGRGLGSGRVAPGQADQQRKRSGHPDSNRKTHTNQIFGEENSIQNPPGSAPIQKQNAIGPRPKNRKNRLPEGRRCSLSPSVLRGC